MTQDLTFLCTYLYRNWVFFEIISPCSYFHKVLSNQRSRTKWGQSGIVGTILTQILAKFDIGNNRPFSRSFFFFTKKYATSTTTCLQKHSGIALQIKEVFLWIVYMSRTFWLLLLLLLRGPLISNSFSSKSWNFFFVK